MKLAITEWNDMIAPVFDFSSAFTVYLIENSSVTEKTVIKFSGRTPLEMINHLLENNVDFLICGAVSELSEAILENSGIRFQAFLRGPVTEVLEHFLGRSGFTENNLLPGACGRQRRNRGRYGKSGWSCHSRKMR